MTVITTNNTQIECTGIEFSGPVMMLYRRPAKGTKKQLVLAYHFQEGERVQLREGEGPETYEITK